MKRHITSQLPNSFWRMQTCMRPSLELAHRETCRDGRGAVLRRHNQLRHAPGCRNELGHVVDRRAVLAVAALHWVPVVRHCRRQTEVHDRRKDREGN